ncbi:hypothetical protein EDB89DRAFT_1976857 [Lactarius sanguifluus]|nr:hypothetical protein EDB89DRAFT_1976857 [Lactarius sanguifluus]
MAGMAEYSYGGPPYSAVSRPYSPPLSVYPSAPMSYLRAKWGLRAHRGAAGLGLTLRTSLRFHAPCAITPSVSLPPWSARVAAATVVRRSMEIRPTMTVTPVPAHDHAAFHSLGRRQEIHHLQIESEQRRRDELRASYLRLKVAVPTHGLGPGSHQKLSKVILLDRATTSINSLEKSRQQLLARIREVEEEGVRLRQANEALALSSVAERPAPAPPPP